MRIRRIGGWVMNIQDIVGEFRTVRIIGAEGFGSAVARHRFGLPRPASVWTEGSLLPSQKLQLECRCAPRGSRLPQSKAAPSRRTPKAFGWLDSHHLEFTSNIICGLTFLENRCNGASPYSPNTAWPNSEASLEFAAVPKSTICVLRAATPAGGPSTLTSNPN